MSSYPFVLAGTRKETSRQPRMPAGGQCATLGRSTTLVAPHTTCHTSHDTYRGALGRPGLHSGRVRFKNRDGDCAGIALKHFEQAYTKTLQPGLFMNRHTLKHCSSCQLIQRHEWMHPQHADVVAWHTIVWPVAAHGARGSGASSSSGSEKGSGCRSAAAGSGCYSAVHRVEKDVAIAELRDVDVVGSDGVLVAGDRVFLPSFGDQIPLHKNMAGWYARAKHPPGTALLRQHSAPFSTPLPSVNHGVLHLWCVLPSINLS